MKNTAILKFVGFIMLTVAMVLIAFGVYKYTEKNKFLNQCKLIKCKVVKIDEEISGEPAFTLKDLNGNYPAFQYYDSYDTEDGEPEYNEGEILDVYYYVKDPSLSEPKDFYVNYMPAFVLVFIGVFFMIDFPVMLFVVNLMKKKQLKNQTTMYGIKDNVISG